MTQTEYHNYVADAMAFEATLTPGMRVVARWTNNNRLLRCPATIERVNRASVCVKLVGPYMTDLGTYPDGHVITIPRLTAVTLGNGKWSNNNRVVHENV